MKISLSFRPNAAAVRQAQMSGSQAPSSLAKPVAQRHPAMRGLDVSPVHGYHCICPRCERRAA